METMKLGQKTSEFFEVYGSKRLVIEEAVARNTEGGFQGQSVENLGWDLSLQ